MGLDRPILEAWHVVCRNDRITRTNTVGLFAGRRQLIYRVYGPDQRHTRRRKSVGYGNPMYHDGSGAQQYSLTGNLLPVSPEETLRRMVGDADSERRRVGPLT